MKLVRLALASVVVTTVVALEAPNGDATTKVDCTVADDSALRTAATPTDGGWMSHEAWVAEAEPQRTVLALGKAVEELFGSGDTLARGLVGMTIDNVAQEIVVVVDHGLVDPAALGAALAEAQQHLRVRVSPSCFSAAELLAARETIKRRDWHPDAARATYTSSLAAEDSRFHVTFAPHGHAVVADALKRLLGDRVVIGFEPISQYIGSQTADRSPHYGGAMVASRLPPCSAGFTVDLPNGNRGSVTADHCADDNENLLSGAYAYGTTQAITTYPTFDMMRIASATERYATQIYDGARERTVIGRENPVVNEYVCQGGHVSVTRCGIRVTELNYNQFCTNGQCTINLMRGETSGAQAGHDGDSGGPVYASPTSTSARIRGMVVGGNRGTVLYAHKVADIEANLGVTVAVAAPTMFAGGTLYPDDRLASADGRFTAVMQTDGNFVVYRADVGAVFASSWYGMTRFAPGARATLQSFDGNFVIYAPNGEAVWASSWAGQPWQQSTFGSGYRLTMQNDGNLVTYIPVMQPVWATRTNCC